MKKSKYFSKFDKALLQSLVFYIILAIFLLPFYQYQINPDGVSYIGIAQKYLLHDYANAVNGYWGPLLSWLLVPFLYMGIKPLLAAKVLSLIIGIATIIQSNSLIKLLDICSVLRHILLYLIAFVVLYFALLQITPDLLFVCLSLTFINLIQSSSYLINKYSSVVIGLLGSGLYLTKSYGFPFFISTFIIISFIFYFRTKQKEIRAKVFNRFISGIVIFSLISACWISIISVKYEYLTIGTAGVYNHAITGPNSLGHPMDYIGLITPPNNMAISAWEDPGIEKIQNWNVFDSFSTMKYEIEKTIKNSFIIISILNQFSLISISLLFIAVAFLLEKGKRIVFDNIFLLIVILGILFSSYALLLIEDRYLWLGNIIIPIIGAKLLDLLFTSVSLKKISKIFLITIFIASFSIFPIKALLVNFNTGKNILTLNHKISQLNIKGRIASNSRWDTSLYLSFYNGWQYYGTSYKPEVSDIETELKNQKIDYYLVWKPFDEKIKFDEQYKEIIAGKIDELKIYKLK